MLTCDKRLRGSLTEECGCGDSSVRVVSVRSEGRRLRLRRFGRWMVGRLELVGRRFWRKGRGQIYGLREEKTEAGDRPRPRLGGAARNQTFGGDYKMSSVQVLDTIWQRHTEVHPTSRRFYAAYLSNTSSRLSMG